MKKVRNSRSKAANWPELREFITKTLFFETYTEEILSEKEMNKLKELKELRRKKSEIEY